MEKNANTDFKISPGTDPIIAEKLLNAKSEQVWQAITDKRKMKEWYFDVPAFEPKVGNEFSFSGGEPGKKQYLHLCKVTEVVPGKKIAYTWRYDGYEGLSKVTFELTPLGDKTKLVLTHEGLHTFPKNNPDFDVKNFVGGWTEIIGKMLPDFLAK